MFHPFFLFWKMDLISFVFFKNFPFILTQSTQIFSFLWTIKLSNRYLHSNMWKEWEKGETKKLHDSFRIYTHYHTQCVPELEPFFFLFLFFLASFFQVILHLCLGFGERKDDEKDFEKKLEEWKRGKKRRWKDEKSNSFHFSIKFFS